MTLNPDRLTAAKAIIRNDAGAVLVLQQSHEATVSNAGRYHVPGGILEPGETLHDAVIREVREETGLATTVGRIVDVGEWEADIRGRHYQFVGVFYECTLEEGNITLDEEAASYKWVTAENLASVDIIEPTYSILVKYLQA
ncbi:MAG TPA: NUDIX hydrolase [Nitrosospira sp.]|nr:NUDIX hydrolase [Nitrosospira sp.]